MNNQFCQKTDKTQTICEARDLPSRKKVLRENNVGNAVGYVF